MQNAEKLYRSDLSDEERQSLLEMTRKGKIKTLLDEAGDDLAESE